MLPGPLRAPATLSPNGGLMAEFPYFAFWVEKFSTDTNHLSDAECGLYLRLLMLMWNTTGCRVPNDNIWLARKLGRSVEVIENTLRPLMREFCEVHRAWVYQKRLSKELQYLIKQSEKNSKNAKSRWNKENDVCNRNAPTPTPTPILDIYRGDADCSRTKKPPHAPTQAPARGQPRKEAKRSPRSPMPEAWQPTPAGLQYATDAGIPSARFPYLIKRCRDYHIRNGTMIAGERGLAATWRTWCDNEVRFTAEKNGETLDLEPSPNEIYKNLRTEEEKRAFMDEHMRKFREANHVG
jgi:uncharacterized protein YdaU (DUF1376 family)